MTEPESVFVLLVVASVILCRDRVIGLVRWGLYILGVWVGVMGGGGGWKVSKRIFKGSECKMYI